MSILSILSILSICNHPNMGRRVLYTDLHSLCIDIYVCFVIYCSVYVYCVHVKFTPQYNGGNKGVLILEPMVM